MIDEIRDTVWIACGAMAQRATVAPDTTLARSATVASRAYVLVRAAGVLCIPLQ